MSEDYRPYVGDEGTVIEVDMEEDLTGFTKLELRVKKVLTGEIVTWDCDVKVGGGDNDNIMIYTIVTDDFNTSGKFICQPYGEMTGWKGHGDSFEFTVYNLFE